MKFYNKASLCPSWIEMVGYMQQQIIEQLRYLSTAQLAEVLDFVEFLQYKREHRTRNPEIIDQFCGKYRQYMSSSEEFARRKQEEIQQEEAKWQKR